jgi:poly(A) polymerase
VSDAALLPAQAWLEAAATRRLLKALAGDGTDVRFVGGCVRDALLGRAAADIDLATPDAPDAVMRKLADAGLRAIATGIAHGTVTALVESMRFEVTTLRRDVETDGRHARVAFTDDWRADAARRDFTMNALSAGPDRRVHDYFGGVADLRAGIVRFVGDPAARIAEDHLRLLRLYRFHAHFGRGAPAPAARAACAAAASALGRLSGERVRDEMLKLLAAPAPAPTLACMADDGVLGEILPSPADISVLARLVGAEPAGGGDALRRLRALLPVDGAAAAALDAVADRLRLSNEQRARLHAMSPALPADRAALRRALHRDGAAALRDRALLARARAIASPAAVDAALGEIDAWPAPRFPLGGADVMARGVAPGPAVGRLLAAVEAWWIDEDFRPDRAACLAQLERLCVS